MIKRPIQRSVWVLLILNVLVLGVVTLDWRADQVRQMSGSVQGAGIDPTREIMVEPPNQNSDSALKTVLAASEPKMDGSFKATSEVKAGNIELNASAECVLIGPFSQEEYASIEALKLGIPTSGWVVAGLTELRRVVDGPLEYRVYAGPTESLNAAYQLLKDFRDQGLDSFVLTDGPLAKSVSLGVFSSYGAAERFVKTISRAEQASLAIHSPGQADVVRYIRFKGAEIERVNALQATGLLRPGVVRKSCSEVSTKSN
jgi:hypothetical protein